MNKNQYWLILATTTFNVQDKASLDAKLKAFGLKAPTYNLESVVADAIGDDTDKKAAALLKLNDPSAFWFMKTDEASYKKVSNNLKKLRAKDFLRIHGALNAVADVTFVFDNSGAEFHVNWVLNRKEAEKLNSEVVTTSFTVSVTNSSTNVTNITPTSGSVEAGGDFTATLTFADGKSADDITVTGGTVSETTLTVSGVTENTTVTITDKE